MDDDIYQESAPLEPDTTATTNVRILDEHISAPVASTTLVTAATFDADDDVSSEEDFMDASEVTTSLAADAEFLAADADNEGAKVAEVVSEANGFYSRRYRLGTLCVRRGRLDCREGSHPGVSTARRGRGSLRGRCRSCRRSSS